MYIPRISTALSRNAPAWLYYLLPSPVDLLLGVGMGLLTLPLWFRLILPSPLSYENVPFPVESPVAQGGPLSLTVERCNNSGGPLEYTVNRTVVSLDEPRRIYQLPPTVVYVDEAGCRTVHSRLNILPPGLPPGTYEMRGVTVVQMPLGAYEVLWRTRTFDVLP